ncbi:MAG: ribonuclease P [Candidatus Micrarchaeota archaeon]|nr:ribonuclease P [Candidatus Micrarchaeota archaeon]
MNVDVIARGRISELLELAKQMWGNDKKLSRRYVQLARKIAMRHRIKLGNRLFCKKCGAVFIPGATVRVRQSPRQKMVLYTCTECGAVRRFGRS